MMNAQSLPLGGTCDQTCWLAEACKILLLLLEQNAVMIVEEVAVYLSAGILTDGEHPVLLGVDEG